MKRSDTGGRRPKLRPVVVLHPARNDANRQVRVNAPKTPGRQARLGSSVSRLVSSECTPAGKQNPTILQLGLARGTTSGAAEPTRGIPQGVRQQTERKPL